MWPWTTKPVIRVNFFEIEIEDNIWPRHNYLKIWNLRMQNCLYVRYKKYLNTEKITFKVVQMKSLAMHITNQKLCFDIFMVGNLQNIFMEHDIF